MKNLKRNIKIKRARSRFILKKEPQKEEEKTKKEITAQQEKKQQAKKKIKLEEAGRSGLASEGERVYEQLITGDSIRISGPAVMSSMSTRPGDIEARSDRRQLRNPLDGLNANDSPAQTAATNQGAALRIDKIQPFLKIKKREIAAEKTESEERMEN